jgi:nitroreductase
METWDAIRARRATREYANTPIEERYLEQILEAGRRAPSSRNEQRWDFILVQDRDQLQRLSQVWRGAAHVAEARAAVGLVAPFIDDLRTTASVHDYDLASEILGLPEDRRLTWMLGLGYPPDRPLQPIQRPDRRPYEEVVHHDHW